jgi:carbonic anhydrase
VLQELPDAPSKVLERACEQQAILSSLDNLMSFNWIRERVEDGRLKLHGWYFDIEHGQLLQYEADNCRFNAM